jgi:hypothetical protein
MYLWARLGFTRGLLVTNTAKKCEPVAGGRHQPIYQREPLRKMGGSNAFPLQEVRGALGGAAGDQSKYLISGI